MDIKNKHVAVILDQHGNCEFVAKVKVINDKELNRYINESELSRATKQQKENELKQKVANNEENIGLLAKVSLRVQAKSVYDNFVDRGLIENDDAFQQMWYDFYFNDGELNLENAPQEYRTIFRKLVNGYEKDN